MTRIPRLRRRSRSRGQALVETALAAPVLLLLLAGSTQVGSIAYGFVTVDTAAREGARAGSENPQQALAPFATNSPPTYQCSGTSDPNPICQAVYQAHGLLDASKFTVTITTNVQVSAKVPTDVVRVAKTPTPTPTPNPCNSGVLVTGQVNSIPAGQDVLVTASGQGTQVTYTITSGSGTQYTLCLAVNTTQTINATTGTGCGGWSGQVNITTPNNNNGNNATMTASPITLTANPCSTPTPTPTPTATPTPTPTATPTPTGTPVPTPPPFTCSNANASSTSYFTVTVTYPVSIFVPLVDRIFSSSNGVRTVQASVTERVEPCSITQTK